MNQIELYHFLYKELAKMNTTLEAYDKIFRNIEIKEKRYGQFFGLLTDIFTRYICLSLAVFFDKRGDSWSLYKFDGVSQENIESVRKSAQHFIDLRHKEFAHFAKEIEHNSNFTYLTAKGVEEIKAIIIKIRDILIEVKNINNLKESYFLKWSNINYSLDCLISDLIYKTKLYGESDERAQKINKPIKEKNEIKL